MFYPTKKALEILKRFFCAVKISFRIDTTILKVFDSLEYQIQYS